MSKKKPLTGKRKLIAEYRKLVTKANKALNKLGENRHVLDYDYGAVLHDKTIVTRKGEFRNNPTHLTVEELENRIGIMDALIQDKDEYFREAGLYTEFGDKMQSYITNNVGWNNVTKLRHLTGQDVADFMSYVQDVLGSQSTPSSVMNITRNRLEQGDTWEEIYIAFEYAMNNNEGKTWDDFENDFKHYYSEEGKYI